ncbi:MAG: outer membrane protein assembly factor BamE [Thiotrichaceae bacterium]
MKQMNKTLTILLLSFFMTMTGCTSYKLEVQQGNAISPEAVTQLKKGMSKAEVTSLLGTPLLQDSFQLNRWDYVFYISKAGKQRERKDLVLTFNGNRLANIKK